MALTAAEEAQTRELLAQQAAILSLADSEPAIISNLGATDVSLSDLVSASVVADADLFLIRQGVTDKSLTPVLLKGYLQADFVTRSDVQKGAYTVAASAGTADAITLTLTPTQTAFAPGPTWWRATAANSTAVPTVKRDGLAAKTLVKGNNLPLVAGDIPGAGAWMVSQYDATLDKEVLLNPATGVSGGLQIATTAEAQAGTNNTKAISPLRLHEALKGSNQSLASSGYQKLPGGLIIQWGPCADNGANLNFPIAFPNACYSITAAGNLGANQDATVQIVSASQYKMQIGAATGDAGFMIAIGS